MSMDDLWRRVGSNHEHGLNKGMECKQMHMPVMLRRFKEDTQEDSLWLPFIERLNGPRR